jgi:transcriptional regulator with XRE-family HTH domain
MPVDVQKQFGKRLAEVRKAKGWSQEKLSLESGVARSYLGGVERGQRNIALVNICRLADTLGVKPSFLLEFNEE